MKLARGGSAALEARDARRALSLSQGPLAPGLRRRLGLGFAAVVLATIVAHLLLVREVGAWMAASAEGRAAPARMQATFVREIAPSVPVVLAAAKPLAAPRDGARASRPLPDARRANLPPEPTPSVPAEPAPDEPEADQAMLSEAKPGSASDTAQASEAPAPEATLATAATPFVWPVGTRLSYALTGSVRGSVEGSAQVEWLREGSRYQVHLEVWVGARFAPLMQRRMSSEGQIGPLGLEPRRYGERTQIAFGRAREATLGFEPGTVTLTNGTRSPAWPGVQDTASQFVQLTYLFATDPGKLAVGQSIELPLALPRRVDRWVYRVLGEEDLVTPFGTVRAWHVKPVREDDASVLSVEAWFAPSLRYLPVRIVIRQGAEDHLDLLVDRLPQEAQEMPIDPLGGGLAR